MSTQQFLDTGLQSLSRSDMVRPTALAGSTAAAPSAWWLLERRVTWALRAADVATAATLSAVATPLAGRQGLPWLALVALLLPLLVWAQGGASVRAVRTGRHGRPAVLRAGVAVGLTILALAQLTDGLPPAPVTTVALPGAVSMMYLTRWGAAWWGRRCSTTGRARRRVLVMGDDEHVAALLQQDDHAGVHEVIGRCSLPGATPPAGEELTALPVLGAAGDVTQVVTDYAIDNVVVAGAVDGQELRRLSTALAGTRAALVLTPGVTETAADRVHVLPVAGGSWHLQMLLEPRRTTVPGKALLDRLLGGLLLALAAPVIGVAGLVVRITSPGPAFYGQVRVGRDGRPFRMWKLRSMVTDADALKAQLAEASDGDGVLFKMRRDPRVTPVGAVLRRYSLDELPQLWNVVKGDMSLVGPRPPLPVETAQYTGEEPRRLMVKPGLTGLWQVSGRSDLSWADSVRLDLRYVDNWSLGMDLRILAATARAVVGGHGAY